MMHNLSENTHLEVIVCVGCDLVRMCQKVLTLNLGLIDNFCQFQHQLLTAGIRIRLLRKSILERKLNRKFIETANKRKHDF